MIQPMLEYLHAMITPTHVGGETLIALDLHSVDWGAIADEHYHGLIARGTPTAEQVEHMWRVVKPGAHVLLISDDPCPTGYLGACAIEDRGFEIRDTILVPDAPGQVHYVSKAGTKERNAGTERLAEGLEEGRYGNFHPTVKPKDAMKALLSGIPTDKSILDPFMGSGTTALACLETGHSFTGIEKEADYMSIADARVRHWAQFRPGVLVHSDVPGEVVTLGGVFDLFGDD